MATQRTRRGAAPRGAGRGTRAPVSRSIEAAWERLARALGEALAVLGADQCLVLSSKRRGYFVQLVVLPDGGVHAEAVSNEWLRPKYVLTPAQAARLRSLGWSAPTVTRAELEAAAAEDDAERPKGWSNHHLDLTGPAPFVAAATLAVTTLREVYGIRRPEQLEYVAFAPGPREILLPTLGIGKVPLFDEDDEEDDEDEEGHVHEGELLRPENADELRAAVLAALREFTDLEDPTVDDDGDIPLRYGSALIILRADEEAPYVTMVSPLLAGVTATAELHEALDELMRTNHQVRFFVAARTVHAALDLVADPFVPDHLGAALAAMGRLCDETGRDLQHRFGGTTAFEEAAATRPRRRKTRYN